MSARLEVRSVLSEFCLFALDCSQDWDDIISVAFYLYVPVYHCQPNFFPAKLIALDSLAALTSFIAKTFYIVPHCG